jgi:hypothetical protein
VLRERLEGLEMEPPAAVWQGITTKMAKNNRKDGFLPWDILLMLLVLAFPLVNYSMQMGDEPGHAVINATRVNAAHTRSDVDAHLNSPSNLSTSDGMKSEMVAESSTSQNSSSKGSWTQSYSKSLKPISTKPGAGEEGTLSSANAKTTWYSEAAMQQVSGENWMALPESRANREEKKSAESLLMLVPLGPYLPEKELPIDSLCDLYVAPSAGGRFKKHEMYLGVSGNVNLPMIINQNTLGAYGPKELAYSPAIGYQASVRLGYIYKNRYAIETGFIFLSHMGQNYSDVFKGKDAKRQVRLDYMHVPLLLQYRLGFSHSKKVNAPWTVGLGAQLDILRSASIGFDGNQYEPVGELTAIPDAWAYFSPIGISGVLNVERDFYLSKFMFVGVGLRASMSGDINSTDHPVIDDYGLSHNFAVGLHVSLNGFLRR